VIEGYLVVVGFNHSMNDLEPMKEMVEAATLLAPK
jgi:hypothetical protein